jgi:hypothetical protein
MHNNLSRRKGKSKKARKGPENIHMIFMGLEGALLHDLQ